MNIEAIIVATVVVAAVGLFIGIFLGVAGKKIRSGNRRTGDCRPGSAAGK